MCVMHRMPLMRTHLQIMQDAGGYQAVAEAVRQPKSRTRFWERRGAFPPEQWKAVADAKLATLEELAEAAAKRAEGSDPPQHEVAA